MKTVYKFLTTAAVLATSSFVFASEEVTKSNILENIDNASFFSQKNFSVSVEVKQVTEEAGKDNLNETFRYFSESVNGNNKFTLIFLEPAKRKGEGFLKIDNTTWFYDPTSREFSVTHSRDRVGSGNSTTSDYESYRYAENFTVESLTESKLGAFNTWEIKLKAQKDTAPFPTIKIWVNKENYLILKKEDYSLSDKLMRTLLTPKYSKIGEYYIPSGDIIIDNLTSVKSTRTFSNISLDKMPETVFTRAFIERASK